MNQRLEQLEQLSAYLDGELTDAERAAVERLLATDPAARALLDELRRTAELVAALPRAAAPPDFVENAVARLERAALLGEAASPVGTARQAWWARGLALAASLALVATAGWLVRPYLRTAAPAPDVVARGDRREPPPRPGESAVSETLAMRIEPAERKVFALEKDDTVSATAGRIAAPRPAAEAPVAPTVPPAGAVEPLASPMPPDDVGPPTKLEQSDQAKTADAEPAELAAMDAASPADQSAPAAGEAADAKRGGMADEATEAAGGRGSTAAEEVITLETLLAAGVMAKADLAAWPAEQVDHLTTVEADEPTQARLVETIREFLQQQGVPDLAEAELPEPIGVEQAFFVVHPAVGAEPASSGDRPASNPGEPAPPTVQTRAILWRLAALDEIQILCRIPRGQAEPLLDHLAAVSSDAASHRLRMAACVLLLPATMPADLLLSVDSEVLERSRDPGPAAATQPADRLVTLAITLRPPPPQAASRPADESPSSAAETATRPAPPPTTQGADRG